MRGIYSGGKGLRGRTLRWREVADGEKEEKSVRTAAALNSHMEKQDLLIYSLLEKKPPSSEREREPAATKLINSRITLGEGSFAS